MSLGKSFSPNSYNLAIFNIDFWYPLFADFSSSSFALFTSLFIPFPRYIIPNSHIALSLSCLIANSNNSIAFSMSLFVPFPLFYLLNIINFLLIFIFINFYDFFFFFFYFLIFNFYFYLFLNFIFIYFIFIFSFLNFIFIF